MAFGDESVLRVRGADPAAAVGRRDFLRALAAVCAGFSVSSLCDSSLCDFGGARSNSAGLDEWLRSHGATYFSDVAALRRLGATYLLAHPEEQSRTLLSRLLIDTGSDPIPSRLRRAIARDWSRHRLAIVDGWLMARSEARLCAFLHLQEGAPA
jgi:hypothetical protein